MQRKTTNMAIKLLRKQTTKREKRQEKQPKPKLLKKQAQRVKSKVQSTLSLYLLVNMVLNKNNESRLAARQYPK